ncbi:IS200/IS605 family transposase [Candidatus Margulisiibacteriota bacterium]
MRYYHVWFQTKRRRPMLFDEIDEHIHELFKQIAREKNINLIAFETSKNHAHLLLALNDVGELPRAVKMLKGISARRFFQKFPLVRLDFRIDSLWARRYGYKEIPEERLECVIRYIRNQKKDFEREEEL